MFKVNDIVILKDTLIVGQLYGVVDLRYSMTKRVPRKVQCVREVYNNKTKQYETIYRLDDNNWYSYCMLNKYKGE